MKCNIKFCVKNAFFVGLIASMLFALNCSESEEISTDIKEKIKIAKKINEIGSAITNKNATIIQKYVNDESPKVRRMAKDQLDLLNNGENNKKDVFSEGGSESNFEKMRMHVKEELNKLPRDEKVKKAIDALIKWKSVYEYEAAILAIIEIGNSVIPNIIELLNIESNIPTSNAPPWQKTHTIYSIILKTLKSIPDERSLAKLQELTKSNVSYVSVNANEAIEWIKSGVPYPFRYERVFLSADDEIIPFEMNGI